VEEDDWRPCALDVVGDPRPIRADDLHRGQSVRGAKARPIGIASRG
jgi:hypothetical protein